MFRLLTIGVSAALSLSACSAGEAQSAKTLEVTESLFSGQWVNDRNSAVTFTEKDGLLSGFYQTALGQPDKSKQFPLTGFVEGDQITFTVNFKGYGSLTSWTGQMSEDDKGVYIRTLWNLTRDVSDDKEDDDLWNSITSGASDFRRMK
ncbi:avidin family protein [Litorimonas taeanensis]|uniref:Avidin family protein n=1 Tax=Litorimonas taeanensis TaxID=568099 RepID=A0A420WEL9_9PROT|nr:avidin/streptavidin family protein [Litorimonas taeanensis]RKQ69382.1 avidin family protein [Litorimonas taeanensis]